MCINTLTSKATDVDVDNRITSKEWLKFAAEREGGRKMREERRRTQEAL